MANGYLQRDRTLANSELLLGFIKKTDCLFISEKGRKSSIFKACRKKATANGDSNALEECIKEFQTLCKNSPFRVIKTIRVLFSDVKHLLKSLPRLKIIHLVRDPRATLASQSSFGKCSKSRGGWFGCSNALCTRLESDVLQEEILYREYPDRLFTIFYHQIASDPIGSAKKLYGFIGAEFTKHAEEYIRNITMSGLPDNCLICTTRSNSSEHINTWKTKLKREAIDMIQQRCNYILQRYEFEFV